MNHTFIRGDIKNISRNNPAKKTLSVRRQRKCAMAEKEDLPMVKTFAAAIVFSTIALGPFAAFADSNTNSANKQTEAPAAAANKQTEDSGAKKCNDILAHKPDHTAAEVADCTK